ncbi:hypothetical protein DEA8626_03029 [Defluviimonas aquaemixtae]|uniref:Uncharacterized protein n=1 Tax=Albidovulum aquaemixtae TaxID=1542388 RepID=A0A2R8BKL7_9RHOB|nr:baseplate J/gp47 family protein [Defluviimonas aquaemixtae]SPH23952.1 hypothetical protein DEA8626_03029 [Defluviimonas aquaemixtae]
MRNTLIPELDDTDFEALVEEARSLIPEIAPEWTDFNLHDPGITIIDLLAWLVDQQIYRIGHVGPSLKRAFTRLMGIAPRPARQAVFDVWPTVEGLPLREFEAGQVARSDDLPDGRFMVAEDVRLTGAKIEEIWLVTDKGRKPLGKGLTEGRNALRLPPADGGGPLALELELKHPIAAGERPVALGVIVEGARAAERSDAPVPNGSGEDYFALSPGRPDWDPVIVEERRVSNDGWIAHEVTDRSFGLTRSGVIRFQPAKTGESKWFRLRLTESFRPGSVVLRRIGFDVVTLAEGWRDVEEAIGFGTGLPDQVLEFPTADIAGGEGRIALESPEAWSLVDGFAASGPEDRHAVADAEAGTIRLGNDLNGRVLAIGEQLRHKPLIRTSGGAGNVARGLRWMVSGRLIGENLEAGTGGRDADCLDALIARARSAAATRMAAMDEATLRALIGAAGLGLARFEVIPRYRPGAAAKGAWTIIIIPDRAEGTVPGTPRADVIDAVARTLDPARLLGERIFVTPPIYRDIDIRLEAVCASSSDLKELKARLTALFNARFSDIARGNEVAPWPVGRDITIGDLRALAGLVEDVRHFRSAEVSGPGGVVTKDGDVIRLGPRDLPRLRSLEIVPVREGTA